MLSVQQSSPAKGVRQSAKRCKPWNAHSAKLPNRKLRVMPGISQRGNAPSHEILNCIKSAKSGIHGMIQPSMRGNHKLAKWNTCMKPAKSVIHEAIKPSTREEQKLSMQTNWLIPKPRKACRFPGRLLRFYVLKIPIFKILGSEDKNLLHSGVGKSGCSRL